MTVYVDDMEAKYGRMKMCHMIADTHEELLAMACAIGVPVKWIQDPYTHREHFDISKAKRALAIENGARPITMMKLGRMLGARRHPKNHPRHRRGRE